MATYIARTNPGTIDGSSLRPTTTIVHAADPETARQRASEMLMVPASTILVEIYRDPFWAQE